MKKVAALFAGVLLFGGCQVTSQNEEGCHKLDQRDCSSTVCGTVASQGLTSSVGFVNVNNFDFWYAQSIRLAAAQDIKTIDLQLIVLTQPASSLSIPVELRADCGSVPCSAALGSTSYPTASLPSVDGMTFTQATFSPTVSLKADTTYWIVLHLPFGGTGGRVHANTYSSPAASQQLRSFDGVTWTNDLDFMPFRLGACAVVF